MKSLLSILLAAGGLSGIVKAVPTKNGLARRADSYELYTGSAMSPSWPSVNQWWSSFSVMFQENSANLRQGCSQFGVPNNSLGEIQDIANAILQVQAESGVDGRFILAVMLQESAGCVRAPTTNYGVRNPGLMQSHNGIGTCNDGGQIQTPCPSNEILQMIRDGVEGTVSGDGLEQLLQKAPGNTNSKYYAAARMYNSGSIASSGLLEQGIATHCYSSDVANRLIGWVNAKNTCTLDGATAPAGSIISEPMGDFGTIVPIQSPYASQTPTPNVLPAPMSIAVPKSASATHAALPANLPAPINSPSLPTPNRNTVGSSSVVAVSNNRAPGVTTNCTQYYKIKSGDICNNVASTFGITFATLRILNTQLDSACSNLWLGYDYCVKGM